MLYHTTKRRWYIIKVGFIGAGKVGVNLGRYFTQKGVELSGFYGRSEYTTKKAAQITKSKFYNNIQKVIQESDIIFITTPDDTISIIDQKISQFDLKNKSVCHASGSLKSTVLSNAKSSGAQIYSIHPIFAFSNKNIELQELEKIYFSIEGDIEVGSVDLPVIRLLKIIGNRYFVRSIEDSSVYHLANVFVSNLTLSLIDLGISYFKQIGLEEEEALKAIAPLVRGNIENIFEKGFLNSLTGPVVRGDKNTIKKHLDVLDHEDKKLYEKLSLNLLKLTAQQKYNLENQEDALGDLLENSSQHLELFKILGGFNS